MAKRPNFLRRVIGKIFKTRSLPTAPPSVVRTRSLKQKAIDNINRQLAMVNMTTVRANVDQMDDRELTWTTKATADQLVNAARQNPDRLTHDQLPLNPWWYH